MCSFIQKDIQENVSAEAPSFSSHLKAFLLKMLPGHWANKGQGGIWNSLSNWPFPPCVSLQHSSRIHIHSQFIYIAVPFSVLVSATNYKWLQWDWSLWLNLYFKAHAPSLLLWSLLIITKIRLYPQLIGWVAAGRKQSQNVRDDGHWNVGVAVVTASYHVNGMQMCTCTSPRWGTNDCGLLIRLFFPPLSLK